MFWSGTPSGRIIFIPSFDYSVALQCYWIGKDFFGAVFSVHYRWLSDGVPLGCWFHITTGYYDKFSRKWLILIYNRNEDFTFNNLF